MYYGKNKANIRHSNIELLRIVAMYMILVFHTVFYELYEYRRETPIFASLMTILHIGVPLFVLITGYFGIKPTIKGFVRLYLLILFYNLLFYSVKVLIGDSCFSYKDFIFLWFPFSFNEGYWFFKVYLMLYIVSPAINYLKSNHSFGNNKLLVLFGIITIYFGWFAQNPSLSDGKNVINFIFIYILGDWLKKNINITDENRLSKRQSWIMIYLTITCIIGVALYLAPLGIQDLLKRVCYGYNSPILLLMSVYFFLIFISFDFKNALVNWIASSSVAVYAVHENIYFFREEWYNYILSLYNKYDACLFVIILLCSCLLLFLLSISIDKCRAYIMQPSLKLEDIVQKWIYNLYNKLS